MFPQLIHQMYELRRIFQMFLPLKKVNSEIIFVLNVTAKIFTCNSDRLPNQDDNLEEEHEEEKHEVCTAVIFERLICRTIPEEIKLIIGIDSMRRKRFLPTKERSWRENQKIHQRHEEHREVRTKKHEQHASDHI